MSFLNMYLFSEAKFKNQYVNISNHYRHICTHSLPNMSTSKGELFVCYFVRVSVITNILLCLEKNPANCAFSLTLFSHCYTLFFLYGYIKKPNKIIKIISLSSVFIFFSHSNTTVTLS